MGVAEGWVLERFCDGDGETPVSLSGSSVNPRALPTEIDSIVLGSLAGCCSVSSVDGPALDGLDNVASLAGLKELFEEGWRMMWVCRKPSFS